MPSRPIEIIASQGVDFDDFYRAEHASIARALAMTLRNQDLASEATDEAMARAFARWDTISHYENPAGWVYRVGLNWANSFLRRLAKRPKPTAAAFVEPSLIQDVALAEALENLDVNMRSVVVCRYLLDWSVTDTALALNIKAGTVKSRLHRALEILERHVDAD